MNQERLLIPVLLAIIFVSILGNIFLYFSKQPPLAPLIPDTSILVSPSLAPSN